MKYGAGDKGGTMWLTFCMVPAMHGLNFKFQNRQCGNTLLAIWMNNHILTWEECIQE